MIDLVRKKVSLANNSRLEIVFSFIGVIYPTNRCHTQSLRAYQPRRAKAKQPGGGVQHGG